MAQLSGRNLSLPLPQNDPVRVRYAQPNWARRFCWLVALCYVCMMCISTAYANKTKSTATLVINEYQEVDLLPHTWVLNNSTLTLDIQRILSPNADLPWQPVAQTGLQTPHSSHTLWLKTELQAARPFENTWVLNIDNPAIDHLTLFILRDGKLIDTLTMGDRLPFSERSVVSKYYLYRLNLNHQKPVTIYLRVDHDHALFLPLKLTPVNEYLSHIRKYDVLSNILYGILLMMGLYHLLISVLVRDEQHFRFAVWIASAIGLLLALTGDGFQLLWPDAPLFNRYALPLAVCLFGAVNTLFAISHQNIHFLYQRVCCFLYIIVGLYGLAGLISLAVTHSSWLLILLGVHFGVCALLSLSMLILTLKKSSGAAVVFLAMLATTIAAFFLLKRHTHVLQDIHVNELVFECFLAAAALLMSLSLAIKINTEKSMRRQKELEANALSVTAQNLLDQYQTLFDTTPIGIVRFDRQGYISLANPAFRTLFGETTANVIGTLFNDAKQLSTALDTAVNSTALFSEERQVCQPNGHTVWVGMTLQPVTSEAHMFEAQLTDITALKMAEFENQELEREKADMISRLVSGVAHEINTPIGTNITALSLMDEELKNIRQLYDNQTMSRDHLASFLSLCATVSEILTLNQKRITALIKKFKDVSVTRLSLSKNQFDLVAHIRNVVEGYREGDCDIQFDLPLYAYWIEGYEQAYTEIIVQLISNSIKYCDKEHCEVHIQLDIASRPARFVYRDNGPGLNASEDEDQVFEPFYTSRPGDPECTGLGLYAVSNLCKQVLRTKPELLLGQGFGLAFNINDPSVPDPAIR